MKLQQRLKKHLIIVEEPHSDDFTLSLGGLALKWKEFKKKKVHNKDIYVFNVFSRSNYTSRNPFHNANFSKARILNVTATRTEEERQCLNFLGAKLMLLGEMDAPLRGYRLSRSRKFKFDYVKSGRKKTDNAILKRLVRLYKTHLSLDCDVYAPLGIGGHVDHLCVRNALMKAVRELKKSGSLKARIFFYEDLPYAGLFKISSDKNVRKFITKHRLVPVRYEIDLDAKLRLLNFHKSQLNRGLFKGIRKRALELQRETNAKGPIECVWFYPAN